jgi:hypothetical protein
MAHLCRSALEQNHAELRRLEDQITELAAHIHAATCRFLELICEFDERGGWSGPGLRSCAHWLNWKCGLSMGAAREQVRVAHALKKLPQISAAFRAGEVSYAKVRALSRVATPANEEYLLMIARHGTAAHMERLVRNYRRVKRIEALEAENHRHDFRELSYYQDDDGCWMLRGRLPPEQGARVIAALHAAQEQEFRERRDAAADTAEGTEGSEYLRHADPVAARRADALVRLAEGYLAGTASGNGGERHLLHLHVELDTLRADGDGAAGELEGSGSVSAETSRRLACDASVIPWLDDKDGEPLSVGRRTRTIPPAIHRALRRRDGGCRFPGCTASRFVDAHHVRHWADGGETRLDNLVLLCRYHHRLLHEGGFGLQMPAAEALRFTRPDGSIIPAVPPTRFRGNVFALMAGNQRAGIHISPETPIPYWYGEHMDDSLAVEGMLALE